MKLQIIPYGTDMRTRLCSQTLHTALCGNGALPFRTLHVLPIPSTKDGVHVRATDVPLAALVAPDSAIVGYALPAKLREEAARVGCTVCDVADDEAFTLENAQLTAVGTVGHLLTHTDRAPGQLHVGIVGYGRIGRELCRLLLFLGARVRVYSGRSAVRQDLGACGIETRDSAAEGGGPSFSGLDVLINTAPAAGLIRADSEGLPPTVLELASGNNVGEGVTYTALPSLPAVMFPVSAAEAYARAATRRIQGY